MDSGLVSATDQGGVPREQEKLKGHKPRVKCHQIYWCTKGIHGGCDLESTHVSLFFGTDGSAARTVEYEGFVPLPFWGIT